MKTSNSPTKKDLLPLEGRSGGVSSLSRVWFAGHGFLKVPPVFTRGKILYYHPDGYFVSQYGTTQKPSFCPSQKTRGRYCYNGKRGIAHPYMKYYGNVTCHRLAAYALSQVTEPPTYIGKKGQTLKKVIHHLIPEPMNFRADNLLFWLTGSEHAKADRRQRALKEALPNGNLHVLTYDRLRTLQDPRITSDEVFARELDKIKNASEHFEMIDPLARMEKETQRRCES